MSNFPRLDPQTLVFAVAILAAMLATVSFTIARGHIGSPSALRCWGASMGCGAATFFLWSVTGYGPFFATFLIANVFAILAVPLGIGAFSALFGNALPRDFLFGTILFGLAGVIGTFFFGTSRGIAIFTMNASLAVQLGMLGLLVYRNRDDNTTSMSVLAVIAIVCLGLTHAGRAITVIVGDASTVVPTGTSVTLVFYYLAFVAYIATTSIALYALNNEKNRRETIERLRRDGLTGLYTRSAFFELEAEIEKRGRTEGYSLLLMDIDFFKAINDKFGHCGGDVVLAHVGRMLANTFRLSDVVVRYGGEEFCVVLYGCIEADAAAYAQRLVNEANRQSVRLSDGRSTKFTLSIGYASAQPSADACAHQESLQSVINRADKALYRAKESGRNQSLPAIPLGASTAA